MSKLQLASWDRIRIVGLLITLCFVGVLLLSSQSAASYPAYILAVVMVVSFRHWRDIFHVAGSWLVIAFLGYLTISGFWSEPFTYVEWQSKAVRAMMVFLFVVAMAECQLRGEVQRWLGRGLAVAGVLATVAALVSYWSAVPLDGRLLGLGQLDNPVVAGLIFGVVLIFLLDIFVSDSNVAWRYVAIACALPVAYTILLTGSRNAWLCASIGCGVFVFCNAVADRQKFFAAAVGLAVIFAGFLFMVTQNDDLHAWLLPRGDSFRLEIWSTAFQSVWNNSPLIGLGILTSDDIQITSQTVDHPHNMYLAIFYKGGLIGLVLFFTLLGFCARTLHNNYGARDVRLALAIFALALNSYLLDGHEMIDKVGETWFLFWIPVGLCVGMNWRSLVQDRLGSGT